MQYELFFLIGGTREADAEKIKTDAEKIVTEAGGVFQEKTTVEKRRLSYEVKHETHGIYVARRFDLEESEKLKDITHKLNLNVDILRFILSRAEELPELKSKEERINEAKNLEKRAENVKREKPAEEKKPVISKTKENEKPSPAKVAPGKEEKAKNEDIDKQLEEILNI